MAELSVGGNVRLPEGMDKTHLFLMTLELLYKAVKARLWADRKHLMLRIMQSRTGADVSKVHASDAWARLAAQSGLSMQGRKGNKHSMKPTLG